MNRIAYIVSTFRKSGPTNQLYYIIKHLDRDLFDPHIVTLSPEPENSMIKKFQAIGCPLYSLHLNRLEGLFFAKRKLRSLLNEIKPVLVHSQGIRGDLLCMNILDSDKHVLSIRNFPSEDYVTKFGFLRGQVLACNHFRVIKKAHYAIACSRMLALKFKEKKKIPLRFIQNGVETVNFIPIKDNTEKLRLKKKYNFNSNDILIITIGSLIPRKNIKTIIQAFMLTQNNAFRLLIIGQGSEENILKSMAKNDKRIQFPGYTDGVIEYLQMSDYYISSSLSEGLPNSVLEGMACGLPVILSDIPSHKELFENSEWSLFFKPDDHQALSQLLNELPYTNWDSISTTMTNIVHQHFSAGKMSEKYQNLYKELLK